MRAVVLGFLITGGTFAVVGIVLGAMYLALQAGGTAAMVTIAFLWLWLIFSFLASLDPKQRMKK